MRRRESLVCSSCYKTQRSGFWIHIGLSGEIILVCWWLIAEGLDYQRAKELDSRPELG
jgi:hypothetical protein